MGITGWVYFGFLTLLVIVLVGVMVFFFQRKRRDRVEQPKYRMLEDDDESK